MASSVPEFWKLAEQSQLLLPQQCQQLSQEFNATNGSTDHGSPAALADWLVSRNIFSRYQATVLMAGRPGPFAYGDYKIYDRIETGRLANEFRAVHAGTGHPVLLRFLAGPVVQDARAWGAAATEAQAACATVHPQLQRFFELVDLGSFKFLVSEDLHGDTLADRLAGGRMPAMEAFRLGRLMAQGLGAIHATGRAHGDVRPLNMWLELAPPGAPGNAKLLRDPMQSPLPPNFHGHDPHGWLLSQSDYMAPDFLMPGKTPDFVTDLYALGCSLYHMLAGHPPFPGGSVLQKMDRHAREGIRPLESYGVPPHCAQLVTFLMAKNPALRYQDARQVADQLAAFIDPSVLNLPQPPAAATLTPYEAAVRQSQARLASQAVQSTFGIGAQATQMHAETHAPAVKPAVASSAAANATPAIRTEPAAIPKGKAIVAPAGAAATVVAGKSASAVGAASADAKIAAKPLDAKALAAKEARDRQKLIVTLVSVGAAAILLIIGVNYLGSGKSGEEAQQTENSPTEALAPVEPIETLKKVQSKFDEPPRLPTSTAAATPSNPEKNRGSATDSGPTFKVVDDDGKLPWASPTSGAPVDLKYVPPLARIFIIVRPSDLLSRSEGEKAIRAFGPQIESMRSQWEQAAGMKWEDCEQLIVALHDNDGQFPKVTTVARLKTPISIDELSAKWKGATAKKVGDETGYASAAWNYYPPVAEEGRVFLMTPAADDIKDVVDSPEPLLKREMERLRRSTDSDRHITLLYDPTFVFSGEGDPLFSGEFARTKEPLRWLLGEGLQAGVLSMHFGDTYYLELRSHTKVDKRPAELAEDFRKRLAAVPDQLTSYIADDLNPPPYWRKLAFKFPLMIEQLHEQTRVGVEDDQAIVNAVLPIAAGHNLVLGTELVMATAPGEGVKTTVAANSSAPKTLEDAMNLKVKAFAFDSLPFENAMRDLATDVQERMQGSPVEFRILVIGKDLEAGSVTRNKSVVNFSEKDKTVAEVLTALVMKANPTVVADPSNPDQTLVWLIGEDPDDKKKKVIITTRPGAIKRGYTLPAPFLPK